MQEKRMFPRIGSQMLVKYIVVTESEFKKRVSDTLTEDISVRGIRFVSEEELPPGTRLVLELNLPDVDHPITPPGKVVWCSPRNGGYEVGVELIWLSFQDEDQLALANYINSMLELGRG